MDEPTITVNIGDTDDNADWIKSLPGHKDEMRIHEWLAKKLAKERIEGEGDN